MLYYDQVMTKNRIRVRVRLDDFKIVSAIDIVIPPNTS